MPANSKKFQLDSSAEEIYRLIEGLEATEAGDPTGGITDQLADSLQQAQKQLDTQRITLIEGAYLLAAYLLDTRVFDSEVKENRSLDLVTDKLADLKTMNIPGSNLLIRSSAFQSSTAQSKTFGYEVLYGNLLVDHTVMPELIERHGFRVSHLSDQLFRAFHVFHDQGINTLRLRIPSHIPKEVQRFRVSLRILARYGSAVKNGGNPIELLHHGKKLSVPLIENEKGGPDPNLTLLSALNGLRPDAMGKLVHKVHVWMQQNEQSASGRFHSSVYNAFFEIKKLSAKLSKPPLELNNIKWMLSEQDHEIISREKTKVAHAVMETYAGSPSDTAKVLKSVYGDDYDRIDPHHLSERLQLSSGFLDSIEQQSAPSDVHQEVLANIRQRLDQVKDEVFDDLYLQESNPRTAGQESKTILGKLHSQLARMVNFFKVRSQTRKKMTSLVNLTLSLDEVEYRNLAEDFKITVEEARALMNRLQSCFNTKGRFSRRMFMAAIPTFARYEGKIFEFLWHHLKEAINPKDHLTFLNSLQMLTTRMQRPKGAFKILLTDFCKDPRTVLFSDNWALILANLIIRKYDKELVDIEITPEDVLMNRKGLDEAVINYASWKIDREQERFFQKVRTIHRKLLGALAHEHDPSQRTALDNLLGLEREAYIFLALIGGNAGKSVIRSAIKEYGDPTSGIYQLSGSATHLASLLQNLRVAVRGLSLIGDNWDLAALEQLRQQKDQFMTVCRSTQHQELMHQIFRWVQVSERYIAGRA